MNSLLAESELHKRDEEYDRQEVGRLIQKNKALADRPFAPEIRYALLAVNRAMAAICPLLQREYLYRKAKGEDDETLLEMHLRWAVNDLAEVVSEMTRAEEIREGRPLS